MNFLLKSFFRIIPSDFFARKYPVSVKGILSVNNKIVLLKNERHEWEPPGGKIEPDETPEQCVLREIKEELNIDAEIDSMLDSWLYKVGGKVSVFIVIYRCKPITIDEKQIKLSFEHDEYGLFTPGEIAELNMPGRYKESIRKILSSR
jgi:8-oxo-dGTP pyrophosphatase MutT (NUDIX family)